jgi:hypothetical protein
MASESRAMRFLQITEHIVFLTGATPASAAAPPPNAAQSCEAPAQLSDHRRDCSTVAQAICGSDAFHGY